MRTSLKLAGRIAAGCAIVLHFGLMLLQVTHAYDWLAQHRHCPALIAIADHYRLITSANRNFRFFAPTVANNWQVQLLVHDKLGHTRLASLPRGARELQIRQHAMMDHFFRDQATMERYAHAWSNYTLGKHPDAERVTVIVVENISPTLVAYRGGQRLRQREQERATYGR